MNTRHLVDPELAAALDQFPSLELTAETVTQIRAMQEEMRSRTTASQPAFPDIAVSERFVPGPEGAPQVRVLIYLPTPTPAAVPALLWMHGGGYVIGSADWDDLVLKSIVSTVERAAVSVDYRLAPETPHPGPVEDCYAALRWVFTHAGELGIDPTRIAIGGAGAGGGLAAGLALLTRDRGEVPLVFQLLVYPMLDDRTVMMAEPHLSTGEFVWTPIENRFGWRALLGEEPGGPAVSPYAAAARAKHLEGLPPTFIDVGALDLFVEEDLEYARRLIYARVPTEFHISAGAFPGFDLVPKATVSQTAMRYRLQALMCAFSRSE